jgi:1-acyl-sn-glycerol-3-phosphate acyltransferase
MPVSEVANARSTIFWFWIVLFGRAAGDCALRVFTFREMLGDAYDNITGKPLIRPEQVVGLQVIWLLFTAIPALALAPLVGAVAAGSARKPVLFAATILGMTAVTYATFQKGPWVSVIGVLAVETLFVAAIRQSLVTATARQAHWTVLKLEGVWLLASCAGCFVGFWFGVTHDRTVKVPAGSIPEGLQTAMAGYGAAFLALLFMPMPKDAGSTWKQGIMKPFFRAGARILAERYARRALFSLAAVFALLLSSLLALVPFIPLDRFGNPAAVEPGGTPLAMDEMLFWLMLLAGVFLGTLYTHPFRCTRIVPLMATAILVLVLIGLYQQNWERVGKYIVLCAAVCVPPLWTTLLVNLQDAERQHAPAWAFSVCGLVALVMAFRLFAYREDPLAMQRAIALTALAFAGFFAVQAWWAYFRPFVEGCIDLMLIPFYRIQPVGEDQYQMPNRGPMLVIANHAAWFDPLWLAKVLPFRTTPMMTASFYDLPVISFLMRRVVGTIRVAEVPVRREAPEIQEAIAALDRGEVVLIFPEGWLRRKEDVPIRRFGRGVWQILSARPDTPVYAGWIEGSWGSYFSWRNGPPTKNKKMDCNRRITIPIVHVGKLTPETLAHHMPTRTFLLQEVLRARQILGLEPPVVEAIIAEETGKNEDAIKTVEAIPPNDAPKTAGDA